MIVRHGEESAHARRLGRRSDGEKSRLSATFGPALRRYCVQTRWLDSEWEAMRLAVRLNARAVTVAERAEQAAEKYPPLLDPNPESSAVTEPARLNRIINVVMKYLSCT